MRIFTNHKKGENQIMKKQIKWTAALSTAAIMAALTPGLAVPAMAAEATGWIEADGTWMFYDSDGYALTDSWKKEDGSWYYLDEDGQLSFDRQIDEYYVGTDGKRVYEQWVKVVNEDDWSSSDAPEYYWYYYGKDGKSVVSKFRTIEDKQYYFDSDGHMVTGLVEIDGSTYYFGDDNDGVMKKGWIQLENEDDASDQDMIWHYFDSEGKMIVNQVDKKISGNYYTFVDGEMQTGWFKLPQETVSDGTASDSNAEGAEKAPQAPAAGYQYYDEDGKRASGWRTIEGIPGVSTEDEQYKFYFKNGQPYFAQKGIELFNIGSAKYGFNAKGEMQTGLQTLTLEDGTTATYYFGDDGVMRTGKQTIFNEDDGINQTWFFHKEGSQKGQGYHGILDNVIYENGLRKQADADLRYAPVQFEGKNYLVNASGTIQKATSSSKSNARQDLGAGFRDFKDSNEVVWTVDTNGIVQ